MELKNKILALFFTTGVFLETWERTGNFDREIKPYEELAKRFNEVYFFTYGGKDDLGYQSVLSKNIKIFASKWNLPSKIYSVLLPLFYRRELREVDVLKTNQMSGSWTAWLAKFLFRKKLVEFNIRYGDIYIPKIDASEPLKLECLHFMDCIKNNKTPRSDGEDGLKVVRVLEATQESLDKGGIPVSLRGRSNPGLRK